MENRAAYGATLDLPLTGSKPALAELQQAIRPGAEFAVSFHRERCYGLRMVPAPPILPRAPTIDPATTCLITGGTKVRQL